MTEASARPSRWSLAALALLHGGVLGWAAAVLPWQRMTMFAVATAGLAVAHLVTGALAVAGSIHRGVAWRVTSFFSLAYLALQTVVALRAGLYLASLYGGLGAGVSAALAAVWAVLALFTIPFAAWGIAATGGIRRSARTGVGAVLLIAGVTLATWHGASGSVSTVLPGFTADPSVVPRALEQAFPRPASGTPALPWVTSLWTREPIACASAIDRPTAFVVTYAHEAATRIRGTSATPGVIARCIQAETADALLQAIAAWGKSTKDVRGMAPVVVSFVLEVAPLPDAPFGIGPLLLRPGLDGVCDKQRCLLDWQLLGLGQFVAHTPVASIPDLRFGVESGEIRRALRHPAQTNPAHDVGFAGLTRLVARSYVVDARGVAVPLERLHGSAERVLDDSVLRASADAEAHLVAAQGADGRFRTGLHPFSGEVIVRGFSIPRQAGATMVLCELGSDAGASAAARALRMLAALRVDVGGRAMMQARGPRGHVRTLADLGSTALPLAAFLTCRPRTGPEHDALIGALAATILSAQRPDGGFHARFSPETGAPIPGPDHLYAAGQAMLALVLLEDLARREPTGPFPPAAHVAAAVERAMDFVAAEYWPDSLRGLFFLEENWHCLAARAALFVHRHEGYERFCLDYVEFKKRLILDETSEVSRELVGGFGFGNVVVPQTTPTAGFAEAFAAAMSIRAARHEARQEDAVVMTRVLAFLLKQQWTLATCFACAPGQHVVGGWSESPASLEMRIDYTQHAWAALGHGGRVLGLMGSKSRG